MIQKVQPDEIYNLAAQSHVAVSFEEPEFTANANAPGALRVLEAIRILGLEKKTRFYQASTSELYGLVQETPQKETTPFFPRSPYSAAKLYAYWIAVNYREAYGIYVCNGILFNHESPVRLGHGDDGQEQGFQRLGVEPFDNTRFGRRTQGLGDDWTGPERSRYRYRSPTCRSRTTRVGTPTASTCAGRSSTTAAPLPTTAWAPTTTC